jgi:hypothetical protein
VDSESKIYWKRSVYGVTLSDTLIIWLQSIVFNQNLLDVKMGNML